MCYLNFSYSDCYNVNLQQLAVSSQLHIRVHVYVISSYYSIRAVQVKLVLDNIITSIYLYLVVLLYLNLTLIE
jgi:hypothetical protein